MIQKRLKHSKQNNVVTGPTPETDYHQIIINFSHHLQGDIEAQRKIKSCTNPEQILSIAGSLGFEITKVVLRKYSRDLSASYYLWSDMGSIWRRNFFDDQGEEQ